MTHHDTGGVAKYDVITGAGGALILTPKIPRMCRVLGLKNEEVGTAAIIAQSEATLAALLLMAHSSFPNGGVLMAQEGFAP